MAAVICVLGPLAIPVGPVPISLVPLAIFLSVYILGTKRGTAAVLIYLLIGAIGVPVFSGFFVSHDHIGTIPKAHFLV